MAKIDTKDAKFDAVRALLEQKHAAFTAHEQALRQEVRAHDGGHSFGRHGYQTGWEAQLIRCCTQVTPDQRHDPMGVGARIRTWNHADSWAFGSDIIECSSYGSTGAVEHHVPAFLAWQPSQFATKGGVVAGAFIGPEQQQEALNAARLVANATTQYVAGLFAYGRRPLKALEMPLTTLAVLVASRGAGFGYGFRRTPQFKPVTHQQVTTLLSALNAAPNAPLPTWEQVFPGRTADFNRQAVANQRIAFRTAAELIDLLGVEAFWQKTARVIFRRSYSGATKSYGPWTLVTAFPDTTVLPPGTTAQFAFDHRPTEEQRQKLRARGLPAGGGGGLEEWIWTGDAATGSLFHLGALQWRALPVPPWA